MDLDRPHFRTTSTGSSSNNTTTASELFICFTSRLSSSSSMKLSKSIFSPGRARDGPASLSTSLSRRLRSNGSLKGGASPFITSSSATTAKKRGGGFENPEPSSPKVTCIGQVRVKTKKKINKQTRSLSRRRSGEASFRKLERGGSQAGSGGDLGFTRQNEDKEVCVQQQQRYSNASAHYPNQDCLPHRNQRWVHLPVTICDALRAFGAEFSCLFPCKSSCFSSSDRDKIAAAKQNGSSTEDAGEQRSCGAVFARWLVSLNDCEGGKRREIELVVGGGDEEVDRTDVKERMSMRSSRRHVFEDIEIIDDRVEVIGQDIDNAGGNEEEAARVSLCVPPKNALLLMRCRSDPVKMASLAGRFSWDAKAVPRDGEDEDISEERYGKAKAGENVEEEVNECEVKDEVFMQAEQDVDVSVQMDEEKEISADEKDEAELEIEVVGSGNENELKLSSDQVLSETEQEEFQEAEDNEEANLENAETMLEDDEEVESNMSSFEALLDQEIAGEKEDIRIQEEEGVEENTFCQSSPSTPSEEQLCEETAQEDLQVEEETEEPTTEKESEGTKIFQHNEENQTATQSKPEPEKTHDEEYDQTEAVVVAQSEPEMALENQELSSKKEKESPTLPQCLLLMMCEPKLSMEVSKETWVCSTDFIRWLPERPNKAAKKGGCIHEPSKKKLNNDSKPKPLPLPPPAPAVAENNQNRPQPPRSSCSLPVAAASMATIIEHKLVNAVGYEPLVLKRCKSEPMRTAAAKLMPENCFWKNTIKKLEPHSRATMGVGAAGVGF